MDGVYTTDPRITSKARKLDRIAYEEMLELASCGAEVLQSRAVEFAKNYGVVLEVVSSFEVKPGTLVQEEVNNMEKMIIRGIAADKNQAKATLLGVPDTPGVAARIFKALAAARICCAGKNWRGRRKGLTGSRAFLCRGLNRFGLLTSSASASSEIPAGRASEFGRNSISPRNSSRACRS